MTDVNCRRARIGSVLTGIASLARDLSAARSHPFGEVRLSRNQLEALFLLAHARRDVTAGALAKALNVTAGAVTQLVDLLRGHGFVETIPRGRMRVVRLTDNARVMVDEFEQGTADRMAPRLASLDDDELDLLAGLLRRVDEEQR